MKKIKLLFLALVLVSSVHADEGMWMLSTINNNIEQMKRLGVQLTAEEIYSNTNSSIKDAVVVFGGGCTGVMVSPDGLLFTNHHCGYGSIQQHSTVERNILKDGFTAKKLSDEIPTPGLQVTFLIRTENVTKQILPYVKNLNGRVRYQAVDSIAKIIEHKAMQGNHYDAQVRSFYNGNEYHLFVYERFTDVRLAYAPPSSIGKFGGDTDNWMYPRHTGDFSMFRVYSSPDGKPADYAKENIPYKPKKYIPISNQGYNSGDFAMILGNPGSTERYATSWAIKDRRDNGNNARIKMRGIKQDVWKKFMRQDEAINIAYANKYAGSSNYWKNSIGMNNAIKKQNVIADKQRIEQEFSAWIAKDPNRKKQYEGVLTALEKAYTTINSTNHGVSYLRESLLGGLELPRFANYGKRNIEKGLSADSIVKIMESTYKDYYSEVDKATFVALLQAYKNAVSEEKLPAFYATINEKFKGDYQKYVDYIFEKSAFTSLEKLKKALADKKFSVEKDPAFIFYSNVLDVYNGMSSDEEYNKSMLDIDTYERQYLAGLMEMAKEQNKQLYPDANFTMRLTYGTIKGYSPADGVEYDLYTTTDGILEKEDAENPEFVVPEKLKQLILNKDFGQYADKKTGKMHVAFIGNNDITGGNSGSPVFNGKGELIGLAFDGNWEAMSGDLLFENKLQRCINVDIRYVLFVMEKYGEAHRLIKELEIH